MYYKLLKRIIIRKYIDYLKKIIKELNPLKFGSKRFIN